MKNIYRFTFALVTLLLTITACDNGTKVPDMKGVYAVSATNEPLYELLPGKSVTINVKAVAVDDMVSSVPVNISFKVDPSLVSVYNEVNGSTCKSLPAEAWQFLETSAIMPRYGQASAAVKLKLVCAGLEEDQVYVLPVTIDKVTGTENYEIHESAPVFILMKKAFTAPDSGDGTQEYPYLIRTTEDMTKIPAELIEGQTTYFKLENDIDMSSIENWMPLNIASPYKLTVDFNGNGHKISNLVSRDVQYASLFGVVSGTVYDLTIENADIKANSACGILGGYIGTTGVPATVRNVHVSGKVDGYSTNGIGGLGGRAAEALIENCSVDATVLGNGKNYIGGLIGYDANSGVEIRNCCTAGSVNGAQRIGGVIGGFIKQGAKISCCYSTMTVTANFAYGGIAGHCNLDMKSGNADVAKPANEFVKCIAWNDLIGLQGDATPSEDTGYTHYSCGCIVGYNSVYNTVTDCFRRADINFSSYNTLEVPVDQPNANEANPQSVGVQDAYSYPYHGKAAAAGTSASSVAKSLGWDENIWDLSGDLPVHKK